MSKCYRCRNKATQTWNICADGNKNRMICDKCDIELNTIVLIFMGFRNWKSKISKYNRKYHSHKNLLTLPETDHILA